MMSHGEEVMSLVFDGRRTDQMSWFVPGRLISSYPYVDMNTEPMDYFSINGYASLCKVRSLLPGSVQLIYIRAAVKIHYIHFGVVWLKNCKVRCKASINHYIIFFFQCRFGFEAVNYSIKQSAIGLWSCRVYVPGETNRRFYINRNSGSCYDNKGWIVVIDSESSPDVGCDYEQGPAPAFLYSQWQGYARARRKYIGPTLDYILMKFFSKNLIARNFKETICSKKKQFNEERRQKKIR